MIVIGAGVVGTSVAYHLALLGAGRVLLIERNSVAGGTTAQSSGILRTHYSVPENVELARRSWQVFERFASYLEDDEASCGLVKCGYLISAAEGAMLEPLRAALQQQEQQGVRVQRLDRHEARSLLPIATFDDAALIGHEPDAGFADPTLVATAFAKAARRRGVKIVEGVAVSGLAMTGARVTGVTTSTGTFGCGTLVSTLNIWTPELGRWLGRWQDRWQDRWFGGPASGRPAPPLHVVPERHTVLAFACDAAPYTRAMPVFKDLSSPGLLYCRSYGGQQMLVGEGRAGEALQAADTEQAAVPLDVVAEVGAQVAARFPAYAAAGLASAWTGVYDVTPDWNPVLGPLPGIERLVVGYGFSGHGFKLSPTVGLVLAQQALGLPTAVPLAPYAFERFARGQPLAGRYGSGAVS